MSSTDHAPSCNLTWPPVPITLPRTGPKRKPLVCGALGLTWLISRGPHPMQGWDNSPDSQLKHKNIHSYIYIYILSKLLSCTREPKIRVLKSILIKLHAQHDSCYAVCIRIQSICNASVSFSDQYSFMHIQPTSLQLRAICCAKDLGVLYLWNRNRKQTHQRTSGKQ